MTAEDVLTLALGSIPKMEAFGQQQLLNSSKLPIDGSLNNRATFESLGFVFGETLDELFVSVTMPNGWHLTANGGMHNSLVDEFDRVRGNVFYKAAPYDRNAHISLFCRYSASSQPVGGWAGSSGEERFEGVVRDGDKVLFTTEPVEPFTRQDKEALPYSPQEDAAQRAKQWLSDQYPDYENILAYWDEA